MTDYFSIFRNFIRQYSILLLISCLLLILPGFVWADGIEVLDLKNKPATDIIPLIEPLLDKNDAVTGTGYQLILRTDKATLSQIKTLLDKIDTRPRNLLISVRNSTQRTNADRGIDSTGSVSLGRQDRMHVDVHATDRSRRSNQNVVQKIRVLEGQRAEIGAGLSVPFRTRQVYHNGAWVTVRENVEYQDAGNRIFVKPTLQGENVRLSIEPEYSSFDRQYGDIRYQSLDTVIIGKLGEWIALGNIDENSAIDARGILSTHRSSNSETAHIEVKVEITE